jgi:hypothetical protein
MWFERSVLIVMTRTLSRRPIKRISGSDRCRSKPISDSNVLLFENSFRRILSSFVSIADLMGLRLLDSISALSTVHSSIPKLCRNNLFLSIFISRLSIIVAFSRELILATNKICTLYEVVFIAITFKMCYI